MLFNSLHFLIFFPIVIGIYLIMPKKARHFWLLAASYYFYMCWNPKYVLLLLASTGITYFASLLLWRFKGNRKCKNLVAAGCIVLNFGILFVFKYFNFVLATIYKVLSMAHITVEERMISLLLPVGISFYIFQAVSYMVDVYREELEPERNFFVYALFVSFFPQLVAGPIERSRNLLPQIRGLKDIKIWNSQWIQQGFVLMLYGFFMKVVIADRAAAFVDKVFDPIGYGSFAGVEILLAMLLFTLQIYCDVAGYSYIAIGAAKICGIRLMDNFNTPYFARSIKDFWDRWHISLSTWFRDYVYIPLGGSRKGKPRKYLNILIIFTLSGLWHGAGWHYVVWGMLHGIYRVVGEMTAKLRQKLIGLSGIRTDTLSYGLWQRMVTFAMVAVAWVFFRAGSLSQALYLLKHMAVWNPWKLFDGSLMNLSVYGLDAKDWNVLLLSLVILFAVSLCRYRGMKLTELFVKQNFLFKVIFCYVVIFFIIIYGMYGGGFAGAKAGGQFIYFQF